MIPNLFSLVLLLAVQDAQEQAPTFVLRELRFIKGGAFPGVLHTSAAGDSQSFSVGRSSQASDSALILRILSNETLEDVVTRTVHCGSTDRVSVARIGDLDGDGVEDYVIGCPMSKDSEGTVVGEVIAISGGDLSEIHRVPGAPGVLELGHSVAGIGDPTGDGVDDYVVSAFKHPSWSLVSIDGATGLPYRTMGSVFPGIDPELRIVMKREGGLPLLPAQTPGQVIVGSPLPLDVGTKTPDAEGLYYSWDLDVSGWAPREPGYSLGWGAVSLVSLEDGSVSESARGVSKEEVADGSTLQDFGQVITPIGDFDGDGVPDLGVAGSSIRVVDLLSGRDLSRILRIESPIGWYESHGGFGQSLASVPDQDGDGVPELLIANPKWSDLSQESELDGRIYPHMGRIWMFSGSSGKVLADLRGERDYGRLGSSIRVLDEGVPTRFVALSGHDVHLYSIDVE